MIQYAKTEYVKPTDTNKVSCVTHNTKDVIYDKNYDWDFCTLAHYCCSSGGKIIYTGRDNCYRFARCEADGDITVCRLGTAIENYYGGTSFEIYEQDKDENWVLTHCIGEDTLSNRNSPYYCSIYYRGSKRTTTLGNWEGGARVVLPRTSNVSPGTGCFMFVVAQNCWKNQPRVQWNACWCGNIAQFVE